MPDSPINLEKNRSPQRTQSSQRKTKGLTRGSNASNGCVCVSRKTPKISVFSVISVAVFAFFRINEIR